MRLTHKLLRLRAKLLREGFTLSALILMEGDLDQLQRENAPGLISINTFDGVPIVTVRHNIEPSFAVSK